MAKLGSFHVARKAADTANGKREQDTFDFEDETFRVVDHVPSSLPLMEFAAAMADADEDDDSVSMEALGAMFKMLKYCVDPADWPRFLQLATRRGAGIEEIFPITQAVWQSVSTLPTDGPSGSPDGPSHTSTFSRVDSRPRRDRRSDKKKRRTVEGSVVAVAMPGPWPVPEGRTDLAVPLTSVDELIRRQAS